jgi:hypothetical protein
MRLAVPPVFLVLLAFARPAGQTEIVMTVIPACWGRRPASLARGGQAARNRLTAGHRDAAALAASR